MALRYALPLGLLILLPACTSSGEGAWPSLAHRPGEGIATGPCTARTSLTARPAVSQVPPLAVPDIAADSANGDIRAPLSGQMAAELTAIRAAWTAERARVAQRIAAAGPAGSESWGTAQIALTRFESVFARTAGIDAQLAKDLPRRALGTDIDPERARLAQDLEAFRETHIGVFNGFRDQLENPSGPETLTPERSGSAPQSPASDETAMGATCTAQQNG